MLCKLCEKLRAAGLLGSQQICPVCRAIALSQAAKN